MTTTGSGRRFKSVVEHWLAVHLVWGQLSVGESKEAMAVLLITRLAVLLMAMQGLWIVVLADDCLNDEKVTRKLFKESNYDSSEPPSTVFVRY